MKSIAGQEMIDMLPEYYTESTNAEAVIDTWGAEFDYVLALLLFIIDQLFAASASAWGLDFWENDLGLVSYAGKPDDQRRSRIISKLRGIGTVTIRLMKNVADSYVYGTIEVIEHPESYSFTIKFVAPLGIPANIADLQEAIEEIKPAHLGVVYEYTYTVWGDVLGWGKTWGEVKNQPLTWGDMKTWKPA